METEEKRSVRWKGKLHSVPKAKQEVFKKEAQENNITVSERSWRRELEGRSLGKRFGKPLIILKVKAQCSSAQNSACVK